MRGRGGGRRRARGGGPSARLAAARRGRRPLHAATFRAGDRTPDPPGRPARTRVLVLTVHDEEEYILPAIEAGATGYLVKDSASDELLAAVNALHAGKGYFGPQASRALADRLRHPERAREDPYRDLTPREREVFHLVVEGSTTKEVARRLGIRVKTADNHRYRMMSKLGVHNTAELVRYAARRGLLP